MSTRRLVLLACVAALTGLGSAAAQPPLPAQIAPKAITIVKRATTLIQVTTADDDKGTGSGFFALQPGIVITNAHVVGMLAKRSKEPKEVAVIIDSGQANERKLNATVVGVDRVNDLAILRVQGNDLPAPLPIETQREPFETQKAYVFGFPLGLQLGKDITISETSISSLRTFGTDQVQQIQVNGGIHQGNSGGPIVNTDGKVIGVSVSVVRGSMINFAVPAHFVSDLASGRTTDAQLGEAFLDKGSILLPVKWSCLDPFGQIKEMRVEVWAGMPGKPLAASTTPPKARSGDGKRVTGKLSYALGVAQGDAAVPTLGNGQVCWLQPVIVTKNNETHWGPAVVAPVLVPVERKPVDIRADFTKAPERSVRMKSVNSETFTRGKFSEKSADNLEVDFVEVLSIDEIGRPFVHVHYGPTTKILVEFDGRPFKLHEKTRDMFRALPPTFILQLDAGLKSRISRNVNPKLPADLRLHFEGVFEQVCSSLEATMLPLPDRKLNPLDQFETNIALLVGGAAHGKAPAKGEVVTKTIDLKLTCTYVGTRTRNQRTEALVTVIGAIKGRSKGTERAKGDVTGRFGIDVEGGFVSFAQIGILTEIEAPGGELRFTYSLDVELDRQPGNTFGVQIPVKKEALAKGKVLLQKDANLAADDDLNPRRKGARQKIFEVELSAGTTYVIDMKQPAGSKLDPYLRLEDKKGKVLAEDDDGGSNLNARIVYQAKTSGVHLIVATSFAPNETGAFQLVVTELPTKK